jgi:uncharacterized protein YndB with AHSA1/START domain
MATEKDPEMKTASRELVIERVFDAPREFVWKTWTEPERLMRWWGPKDFTAPVIKNDLRVGGKYLYLMRAPDGKDYWSAGVYREIVPMERIVATDSFANEKGNIVPAAYYGLRAEYPLELMVTVTFEEREGKTKLTIRHAGHPPGDIDLAREGWNQSLDKFAEAMK